MRSWVRAVVLVVVAVALALAALPFWLGAVLPALRRPLHLTVGSYRREGYGVFVLRDASYASGPVRVHAGLVRLNSPLVWAWRHARGADQPVLVSDWAVQVGRSHSPPSGRPVGMVPLHGLLWKIAGQLRRWLPRAELQRGRVEWPGGGFGLAQANWNLDTLQAAGFVWAGGTVAATIRFEPTGTIAIEAAEADRAWRARLDWTGAGVAGTAWAWEQPLRVSARYDPQGWLPHRGEAHAVDWDVAGARAGIGALYAAVCGGADAEWDQGRYRIQVHARAAALHPPLPDLQIDLNASGDAHGWAVSALRVESAFAQLELTRPIRFPFGGRPDISGAEITLRADLARVPGLRAQGAVEGRVVFTRGAGRLPGVDFRLTASGAGWKDLPRGDLTLAGSCELDRRILSGVTVHGRWTGPALRPVLPGAISVAGIVLDAHAAGPLDALRHDGRIVITQAHMPPFHAGDVTVSWQGSGFASAAVQVRAALRNTLLKVGGRLTPESARIDRLDFAPGGTEALHLTAPAGIAWRGGLRCDALRLSGGGAAISADLRRLAFSFQVTRIPAAWVSSLIAWSGPNFVAQSAGLDGRWENGRLVFSVHADAELWLASGVARLTVSAAGDGRSLRIREARIESGGQVLASAQGEVPAWWEEEAPHLRFDGDAPLAIRADTGPDSPAWAALADTFGLRLLHPKAFVIAKGTLRQPVGEFHLQIGELATAPGRLSRPLPAFRNLVLNLHADRGAVVLDRLGGAIAGHTVFAAGRMPMTERQWSALLAREPVQPWKGASGTVEIGESGLEAVAALLPRVLTPRGRWSARFQLKDGVLDGTLHLRGLALRPIAPLGLVQNIGGDIECHGRAIDISRLTAEIGGETVRLGGRVDLPATGRPSYVLSLEGANIPLVRQSHLLVRSNLDLRASTVGADTRITGTVAITDALLLGDLSDLVPSGVAGVSRPPPYFAIDTPPLAGWHLDVQLTADHTLRARTTLFSGDASAQFRLTGQLSDPRAVGQLHVDQGQISLPFATFDVQVAAIRLDPDDPFHPRIDVVANARRFDYDLRMNATGTADAPVLTFTSNPALPSDQILQMVMAGQMPQTGSWFGAGQSQVTGLGEYVGQGLIAGLSGSPGSNRLSIASGQQLSVKGKPTYTIEYRLSPRWWLVADYDEFDAYNAGVRWRVYTKGGKP